MLKEEPSFVTRIMPVIPKKIQEGKMTGYISASEYCAKYLIHRATLHRLIKEGRIPAERIGNQWVIPADAPRPEDRRVKSGKYCNWKDKMKKKPSGEQNTASNAASIL